MNHMFGTRYLSMDAPEGSAAPDSTPAPAQSEAAPVTQSAPAPPPADVVPRSEYSSLEQQLGRAEGRAKQSQRLTSVAEQYGYKNLDDLADALQTNWSQQSQPQSTDYYSQQQPAQRETHRSDFLTSEMIDDRISRQIGINESISSHNVGRESENSMISQMLASPEFSSIFEGIDQGEYGSVFDAAYSGAGSAAAEVVASAIDNAIYGATTRYGDDAPNNLQGKSMPLKDSAAFEQVQGRVLEGLRELAAMNVFAATKQGMADFVPTGRDAEGEEISLSDEKEKRAQDISDWAQQQFEDSAAPGTPASN